MDGGAKVKICGLKRQEEIECCINYGAAFIGFVVFPKSPRFINLQQLKELQIHKYSSIKKVLVGVDMQKEEITQYLDLGFNVVQPHFSTQNSASVSVMSWLFGQNVQVIHPFGVDVSATAKPTNPINLIQYKPADIALLDTKIEGLLGGSGVSFNWKIVQDLKLPLPFFLSGGINEQNIVEALKYTPYIDLSSGVESERGVKDVKKIKKILELAKNRL
jgi:phosphoribosylanthranilate isomerase